MTPQYDLRLPDKTVAIIYAGGAGTRLWPYSSKECPKQINPVFSKKTLLVDAFERTVRVIPKENIIVIVTEYIKKQTKDLLPIDESQIIVQPETIDTAGAMGLAALIAETRFPDSVVLTVYADIAVQEPAAYVHAIRQAIAYVRETGHCLTIGTKPIFPSTQLGYIQTGKTIASDKVMFAHKFIEKPDLKLAMSLVKDSTYLWNTGIYIWKPSKLLHLFKIHAPVIYSGLIELRASIFSADFQDKCTLWHTSVPRTSFEKIISEHTKEIYVFKADFGWRDIGNWSAVYDVFPKSSDGNVMLGQTDMHIVSIESSGCLIAPKHRSVALVGVKDLIVIETDDELLICNRAETAKVKLAVKKLDEII